MSLLSDVQREFEMLGFSPTFHTLPDLFKWLKTAPLRIQPIGLIFDKPKQTLHGLGGLQFQDLTPSMSGSFGVVQLAYCVKGGSSQDKGFYCFLKASPKHQATLFVEGLLQSLAHATLRHYGFPHAVPRVLSFVQQPELGKTLVLEKIPNAQFFSDYLKHHFKWGAPCVSNDLLVLSVICQVATYMAILEYNLRMNHRDLKGTNVLMVAPVETYVKPVTLGVHAWKLQTNVQVSIIDFGFTCVGTASGDILLSAGEFMPSTDFCPKEGRDLFLFLASLWNVPAFRESIGDGVTGLFRSWLQDSGEKSWADWLVGNQEETLMSMYLLTSASGFSAPASAPLGILKDISRIAPDLIQFAVLRRPSTPVPDF